MYIHKYLLPTIIRDDEIYAFTYYRQVMVKFKKVIDTISKSLKLYFVSFANLLKIIILSNLI